MARSARMIPRFVVLAVAALSLGTVDVASAVAQPAPTPTPVTLPTLPPSSNLDPYARAAIDALTGIIRQKIQNAANSSAGKVTYFKRFEMQIRTGTNAYRSVHLHQGTVIDPRGASIAVGQRVSVSGAPLQDGSLDANVITLQQ